MAFLLFIKEKNANRIRQNEISTLILIFIFAFFIKLYLPWGKTVDLVIEDREQDFSVSLLVL